MHPAVTSQDCPNGLQPSSKWAIIPRPVGDLLDGELLGLVDLLVVRVRLVLDVAWELLRCQLLGRRRCADQRWMRSNRLQEIARSMVSSSDSN